MPRVIIIETREAVLSPCVHTQRRSSSTASMQLLSSRNAVDSVEAISITCPTIPAVSSSVPWRGNICTGRVCHRCIEWRSQSGFHGMPETMRGDVMRPGKHLSYVRSVVRRYFIARNWLRRYNARSPPGARYCQQSRRAQMFVECVVLYERGFRR